MSALRVSSGPQHTHAGLPVIKGCPARYAASDGNVTALVVAQLAAYGPKEDSPYHEIASDHAQKHPHP